MIALALAATAAAQIGGRPARPKVQRPDGATWDVLRKHCIDCHGIDDYAFYAQDRAAWQKLIAAKHKPGEAVLSEADQNLVLDWLASKFGPTTKPFPRTYVPARTVTGWSASRRPGMRKKGGESRWWICGNAERSFRMRNWNV